MVSGGLKWEKWPCDAFKGDLGREEVLPNDISRAKCILEQACFLLPFRRYRWALIDCGYEGLPKSAHDLEIGTDVPLLALAFLCFL